MTAVATVIEGANVYIKDKMLRRLGRFQFAKASITASRLPEIPRRFRRNPDLTIDDLAALRQSVTYAEQIGAQDGGGKSVKHGNITLDGVGVQGVTPNTILISNVEVEQGRYISDFDDESRRDVAFLGSEVADGLFPQLDPIGKEIKIGGDLYTVIGVAKKLGSVLGQSQDNFVQLPLMTFFKAFGKRSSPTFRIIIRSRADVPAEKVQDQVRVTMRTRHKLDYNSRMISIATDEAPSSGWFERERSNAVAFRCRDIAGHRRYCV